MGQSAPGLRATIYRGAQQDSTQKKIEPAMYLLEHLRNPTGPCNGGKRIGQKPALIFRDVTNGSRKSSLTGPKRKLVKRRLSPQPCQL